MAATKHEKWYDAIMDRARYRDLDGHGEWHHVLPKALGGDDDPRNLVQLTYREHFLAHWLLVKFTEGRDRAKMACALHAMTLSANGTRIVAGWQFEAAKRALRREALMRLYARRDLRLRRQAERLKEMVARREEAKAQLVELASADYSHLSRAPRGQLAALTCQFVRTAKIALPAHKRRRKTRRGKRLSRVPSVTANRS